jgi:hypothetical protein
LAPSLTPPTQVLVGEHVVVPSHWL